MKTIFRIFSLVVAMTLCAGAAFGANKMFYDTRVELYNWDTSVPTTQDGANYTATLSLTVGTKYFIGFSQTDVYSGVYDSYSTQSSYTVNAGVQKNAQGQYQIGFQEYNYDNKRYQYIWLVPSEASIIVTYNKDNHTYTINTSGDSYTVSTSGTNCTFSPTSAIVAAGDNAIFTITPATGYQYASHTCDAGTVVRNGNTFTVTPTSAGTLSVTCSAQTFTVTAGVYDGPGSVSPTQMQNVAYGSSIDFEVVTETGFYVDQERTTYTGSAEKVFTQGKISLENIKSAGELKVYFKNDQKPVVYVGAYPTQGTGSNANYVNLEGYLSDRHCLAVSAAGFYWKGSKDITLAEVESAISETSSKIISATNQPDTINAGDIFRANNVDLQLQQNQEVFIVAYATAGGNTNISKVIGFKYQPCNGIESVTLTPATAQLPAGYSNTFSAVARSAGKSPVYAWYDKVGDGEYTLIAGQSGQTLTYTMPDAATHTIKVAVSEADCGSSREATATLSTCAAPTVSLAASKSSDTPWQPITISATVENSSAGTWSVTPEAELNVNGLSAVLNATVLSGEQTVYTVTYTANSQCTNSDVKVSESIQITIVKDHEDCTK